MIFDLNRLGFYILILKSYRMIDKIEQETDRERERERKSEI